MLGEKFNPFIIKWLIFFYCVISKDYHAVECDDWLMGILPKKLSGIFAKNTKRARKSDWKLFHAWCVEKNYISLPKEVRMGF